MTKLIDVSEHNGWIDWNAVKNSGWHAIIRVGYGDDYTYQDDARAVYNMDMCEALGIPYGVYIYSYAQSIGQAQSEAYHVLRMIQGRHLSYPVYFDTEEPGTQWISYDAACAFGDIIEANGYWCGVYASRSWWQSNLQGLERFTKWVACWGTDSPGMDCDLWQYTSDEVGPGCGGRTDCNIAYRDFPAEIGGSTPTPKPQPAPDYGRGSIDEYAQRVLAGEFGNGDDRRAALGDLYDAVQARVNEILGAGQPAPAPDIDDLARRVIAGEFGNGQDRVNALGGLYDEVQAKVNEMLGAPASSVNIDDLALRAYRGEFGNGQDRRNALGGLYDQVQARLEELYY